MRAINLFTFISAHSNLTEDEFEKLCKLYGSSPKFGDLKAVSVLIKQLQGMPGVSDKDLLHYMNNCYFGYKIPHIAKEIDCLWIADSKILDIELKSAPKVLGEIEKQLQQNKFYLSSLQRDIKLFTYESSQNTYYKLDQNNTLQSSSLDEIWNAIHDITDNDNLMNGSKIDDLFNPSDFLVSPFNSTDRFLEGAYFLTQEQQQIKQKILKECNNAGYKAMAITGPAGSGKTLLVYDIAKELMAGGIKVSIAHCGAINAGQETLKSSGWLISRTKDYVQYAHLDFKCNFNGAQVVIIDEAQRNYQLPKFKSEAERQNVKLIISYDPVQCLDQIEVNYQNDTTIRNIVNPEDLYTLKAKIRSNPNIINFIDHLFDCHSYRPKPNNEFIDITYCSTGGGAKLVLSTLKSEDYVVPCFTPSKSNYPSNDYEDWFPQSTSAHAVVGQEFDKVAIVISPNLKYDGSGKLESTGTYRYDEVKMLYQIASRARKHLHVIVINNKTMYERCMTILQV